MKLRRLISGVMLALLVVSMLASTSTVGTSKLKSTDVNDKTQKPNPYSQTLSKPPSTEVRVVASKIQPASVDVDWWPAFHHNSSRTGFSTSPGPAAATLLWQQGTKGYIMESSPAIADGKVYATFYSGTSCIDAMLGSSIWTANWLGTTTCSPAVDNGKVYVEYSGDAIICCLDASNGKSLWNYTTSGSGGGVITSSPAIVNGLLYVGASDGKVYCLDASTGAFIWSYPTGKQVDSSPAVVNGMVYVGSTNNNVYCLNASNGTLLWNYTTSGSVDSSPAVVDGMVYVGSGFAVYCLAASNGTFLWKYQTGGSVISSPAVAYGNVYVGSEDGYTYCLAASSGTQLWRYMTGAVYASPAIAGGYVYVSEASSYKVYCFSASGGLIWSYTTKGPVYSSPAVANGMVYVGSCDGYLYCLGQTSARVEIHAYDKTVGGGVSVPISINGTPSGQNTPYAFSGLTGSTTFGVPSTDLAGHPFVNWSDGETTTSITVPPADGYYQAYYQAAPSPPSASATANPTSGNAPLSVQFTGSASGGSPPYSYSWSFGDGGTSNQQSPSHTYQASGNYAATLTVTDSQNSKATSSVPITVSPHPVLSASASANPTSGTAPLTVQFTGSASGGSPPYSYSWSFGDSGSSTMQNPSHIYQSAGSFSATLTGTDSVHSTATSSVAIGVEVPTYSVTFTESGLGLGVQWSVILNGQTKSSTSNSIVFNVPGGNYPFSVGCPNGYTAVPASGGLLINGPWTVQIKFEVSPAVSISPTSVTMDIGQSQLFTASASGGTPPYTYSWYLDTALVSGATSSTWTYTPTNAALHSVFVRVTDSWAVSADSAIVSARALLVTTSTSLTCSPATASIYSTVTCTAVVSGSNPTGTVTWKTTSSTGSFSQSPCALSSGSCSTTYVDTSPGSVTIDAIYSGDSSNAQSSGSAALTLKLVLGVCNVATLNHFQTKGEAQDRGASKFSIQQNLVIPVKYSSFILSDFYWVQNIIYVIRYSGVTMMGGGLQVYESKLVDGVYQSSLVDCYPKDVFGGVFPSFGLAKNPVTLETTIDGNKLFMANDYCSHTFTLSNPQSSVLCIGVYPYSYGPISGALKSPEIVIVGYGQGPAGSMSVDFVSATDGSVDSSFMVGDGSWVGAGNLQVVSYGLPSCQETSTGLKWDTPQGTFEYDSAYTSTSTAKEGFWFMPNFSTSHSAPSLKPGHNHMIIIIAICPVYLGLYDFYGRHTGFNGTTEVIDAQIPEAMSLSNQSLVILDPSGNYSVALTGTANGTYQLEMLWLDVTGITSVISDLNGTISENETQTYSIGDSANVTLTSILPSKNVVFQGYSMQANVTVAELGAPSATFNVTLYANDTVIGTQNMLNLSGWNSTDVSFAWNTSGLAKGAYFLWAYAEPSSGGAGSFYNFTGGWVYVSMVGDLTGGTPNPWDFVPDGKCSSADISVVARCFGSSPDTVPPMRWEPNCDLNNNGHVDGADVATVARHFGESDP